MPTRPDKVSSKEFVSKVVPEGTHLARCYSFLHIGHVPNTFPGSEGTIVNKIRLTWELPEETTVFKPELGEQPYSISQEYTLSMNEKANLRKMVASWLGVSFTDEEASEFDAESLVGQACLLTVVHQVKNDKTYSKIQNVTKLPSKMACPPAVNEPRIQTWDTMTVDTFNALPEFIQAKLKESTEYKEFAVANGLVTPGF